MKAYEVTTKDLRGILLIYAEDRHKAQAIAIKAPEFAEARYVDLRARRVPEMDGDREEGTMLRWDDREGRMAMVRYMGLHCETPEKGDCDTCAGEEWCLAL